MGLNIFLFYFSLSLILEIEFQRCSNNKVFN